VVLFLLLLLDSLYREDFSQFLKTGFGLWSIRIN
jgi:hypothetical protein